MICTSWAIIVVFIRLLVVRRWLGLIRFWILLNWPSNYTAIKETAICVCVCMCLSSGIWKVLRNICNTFSDCALLTLSSNRMRYFFDYFLVVFFSFSLFSYWPFRFMSIDWEPYVRDILTQTFLLLRIIYPKISLKPKINGWKYILRGTIDAKWRTKGRDDGEKKKIRAEKN